MEMLCSVLAVQTHSFVWLKMSFSPYFCKSVNVSVSLCLCLSLAYLSIRMFAYLSVCRYTTCLCLYLSPALSRHQSITVSLFITKLGSQDTEQGLVQDH